MQITTFTQVSLYSSACALIGNGVRTFAAIHTVIIVGKNIIITFSGQHCIIAKGCINNVIAGTSVKVVIAGVAD